MVLAILWRLNFLTFTPVREVATAINTHFQKMWAENGYSQSQASQISIGNSSDLSSNTYFFSVVNEDNVGVIAKYVLAVLSEALSDASLLADRICDEMNSVYSTIDELLCVEEVSLANMDYDLLGESTDAPGGMIAKFI